MGDVILQVEDIQKYYGNKGSLTKLTVALFLVVYGSYFLATCLSCKWMVAEQKGKEKLNEIV